MEFLIEQVKVRHHQLVMSTHSPAMIRHLPPDAIKVFVRNAAGRVALVSQESEASEAFFYIGEPIPGGRTILVEDALAAEIVRMALRHGGAGFATQFDVKHYPGGSAVVWQTYPTFPR